MILSTMKSAVVNFRPKNRWIPWLNASIERRGQQANFISETSIRVDCS